MEDYTKLSKEELIELNTSLIKALENNQRELIFTRIGFLFKVIEYSDKFSSDFVIEVIEELELLLKKPNNGREEGTSKE